MRDLCYVVDETGKYTSVMSLGWEPKNEAIRLAWKKVHEKAAVARDRFLEGRASPLVFWMHLSIMSPRLLAGYMGLPVRKVRRHLTMKGFQRLSPELVSQYARVLNIPPGGLSDAEFIRNYNLTHDD